MTINDILNLPLEELSAHLKEYIDVSVSFWTSKLNKVEVKEEPKIVAEDLKSFLQSNVALVEKYKATNAESLFKHLVTKFSTLRGVSKDEVEGELKSALTPNEMEKKLLSVPSHERAHLLVETFVNNNAKVIEDLVDKILSKDEERVIQSYKDIEQRIMTDAGSLVNIKAVQLSLRNFVTERALVKKYEQKNQGH